MDHILYDSIYMKCPNRQIHTDSKIDYWVPRAGEDEGLGK